MTMDSNLPQAASRSSTLMRTALFVSLALNMFFLGAGAVVLGRFLSAPGGGMVPRPFAMEFPAPGMMFRALPEESRHRLEAEFRAERSTLKSVLTAARQARREAFQAFEAEPFSASVYAEKLAASRSADLAAVNAVHGLIARVSADLRPEDRAAVVEALKSRRGFFGPHLPQFNDGPPPP